MDVPTLIARRCPTAFSSAPSTATASRSSRAALGDHLELGAGRHLLPSPGSLLRALMSVLLTRLVLPVWTESVRDRAATPPPQHQPKPTRVQMALGLICQGGSRLHMPYPDPLARPSPPYDDGLREVQARRSCGVAGRGCKRCVLSPITQAPICFFSRLKRLGIPAARCKRVTHAHFIDKEELSCRLSGYRIWKRKSA